MMSTVAVSREDRELAATGSSRRRRLAEAVGFVAAWVGLGYLLHVGDEAYLLLGIPLTIAFQVLVRRRPLRELLVRDGGPGRAVGRRDVALTALVGLAPAYWAVRTVGSGDPWVISWYAAALAGAAAAAYALCSTTVLGMLRSAAVPVAVGVVGNVLVVGAPQLVTGRSFDLVAVVGGGLKWLAIYFPATFVIEEVAFRGALDSHVHRAGEGRGWQSALLVSALWGLWHLPVSDGMPLPVLVLSLLAWQCAIGVPLSFAWRRSGNLAGPALAHATIDAVRNGLLGL
jgi:membrane protease YdiL (CAAX protease family)